MTYSKFRHPFISALCAITISTMWGPTAFADSFCGYDAGLIGTKAIGYIMPYSLTEATVDYQKSCKVKAYESPTEEASQTHVCTDFVHMPSQYVDGSEQHPLTINEKSSATSEYFSFLVFDTKEDRAQITLKTGQKKWVKIRTGQNFSYHYREDEKETLIRHTQPTQGGIYSAPRLNAPDPFRGQFTRSNYLDRFENKALMTFFSHPFYTALSRQGIVNIESGFGKFANSNGSGFSILYKVTEIIKDSDGREWLKAEEYFSQHTMGHDWDWQSVPRDDLFSGSTLISKPLRTVYFPYREPSGTITMVMIQGGSCD